MALGVSDLRLRARDIRRIARGIYQHLPRRLSAPSGDSTVEGAAELHAPAMLHALCRRTGKVRVSHISAARLYGLPIPQRFHDEDTVYLAGSGPSHGGAEDPQVILHRRQQVPDCSHLLQGVPVTPPAELFAELGRYLHVPELVVVGDQLVRIPRARFEGRDQPWCTLEDLGAGVRAGRFRTGVLRARKAQDMVRVGSDSPAETYMRLAIVHAGLPEPELQIRLHPQDRYSPVGDAGYRKARIVLQYEGAHHYTAAQQARDQRRNAAFEAAGWRVILMNCVDYQEGFRAVTRRLYRLLNG